MFYCIACIQTHSAKKPLSTSKPPYYPPLKMVHKLSNFQVAGAHAIIKVLGHQHRRLAGFYDLEIGHFKRWIAWWIVAFLPSVCLPERYCLTLNLVRALRSWANSWEPESTHSRISIMNSVLEFNQPLYDSFCRNNNNLHEYNQQIQNYRVYSIPNSRPGKTWATCRFVDDFTWYVVCGDVMWDDELPVLLVDACDDDDDDEVTYQQS